MNVPGWVVDAVSPTDDELARLDEPVPAELLEAAAAVTEAQPREVASLVRRLRARPEGRRRLLPAYGLGGGSVFAWGLALAAASAVVVASVVAPPAPTPPALEAAPIVAPLTTPLERPDPVIPSLPEPPASTSSAEGASAPPAAGAADAAPAGASESVRSGPPSAASRTDKAPPPVDPLPTDPPETMAVLSAPVEPLPAPDDDADGRTRIWSHDSFDVNRAPPTPLRLTELFLQRHPDSPLAEEATILRLELLAQTAPPRQAMAALDGWLSAHADHAQFLPLLEVRANLARNGMQNCRTALNSYRTLAKRARGARKARALAFGGLCALSEGLDDEARESLDAASGDAFLPENLRFEVIEALAHLESMGRVIPLRRAQ
jgi:hypothetical protein